MLSKRLNIMFYSNSTGEQIILPINPEKINLKYEKEVQNFNILGFGEINLMGCTKPLSLKLSHFLPEDDSIFNTNSSIMYQIEGSSNFREYSYSSILAIEMFKKWALEKRLIRVVIDDVLNMECFISSFQETLRENTISIPYILELIEYRSPNLNTKNLYGLYSRKTFLTIPKTIVMKKDDTVYSIADKYQIDFEKLAKINNIENVNEKMAGFKLTTVGV